MRQFLTECDCMREARDFSRDRFGDLIAFVAQNGRVRWPSMTPMVPGAVAWQLPVSAPKQNIRLWYDSDGLAAYAWFQPPSTLQFDVRAEVPFDDDLAGEMLAWTAQRRLESDGGYPAYLHYRSMDEWADGIRNATPLVERAERFLVASALESDAARTAFLERNGFRAMDHFEPFLIRKLEGIPNSDLPDAIVVRHVNEAEFEQRVAAHRAAWAPSTGFSMERYLKIRAITPPFDPELDLVAVTPDGTVASCCICWADPVSRVGFFEPFGTRPEYRGSDVSRRLIHEGFRRLKAKGMAFAMVFTACFNHPAQHLYRGCGFEQVDVNRTWLKPL